MPNPAFADQIALAYLHAAGIPAEREKGRVVAYNGVRIKVLYSTQRRYGGRFYWNLPHLVATVCDVLMLIADDGDDQMKFLFDPLDAAFYHADEHQKRSVTWYPERVEQRQHEQLYEALTTPVMTEARDRLALIELARARG